MNLESLSRREHFARQISDPYLTPARVVISHRDRFVVWTEAGQQIVSPSGRLRHDSALWLTTGDWVLLRDGAAIECVLERQSSLTRRNPGGAFEQQTLAANINLLFIVAGLDLGFNSRRPRPRRRLSDFDNQRARRLGRR